jgi:hypothetical protein
MKTLIIFFLFGFLSCSREDYLRKRKTASEFWFGSSSLMTGRFEGNILTDSLKFPFKQIWNKRLDFKSVEGLHFIEISNGTSVLSRIEIVPSQLRYELSIPISSLGLQNYWLNIVDWNENKEVVQLNLFVFDNLPPVAAIEYNQGQKMLDFSKSFDLDERFGGKIVEYWVFVNNVLRKQDEVSNFPTTINNGFRNGTSYLLKLETRDKDGAVSTKETIVLINN